MNTSVPQMMRAAAIDRFGAPRCSSSSVARTAAKAREVLIRLETAGIGVWDRSARRRVRDGSQAEFPRVIGNDGAGTVVAVGSAVKRFKVGDRVYAYAWRAGSTRSTSPFPKTTSRRFRGPQPQRSGALGADGITALPA